jgi:homopolymeric O-antigen transport system permease protein
VASVAAPFWQTGWNGSYLFLFRNLIAKDFRVRYRNMSLGIFWSLLNPLVMMGVMWFVFTKIFADNRIPNFAAFVLCGMVPYNFFTVAWVTGTTSLLDNTSLIKRVAVPRAIIPIATVMGNVVHLLIQVALLLTVVLIAGKQPNVYWLWLPFVWSFFIVFVCGLSLVFASLNIYIRDIRYIVESTNVVLFWLVPIFYDFKQIAPQYREIYRFNPVAAMVMASRNILLDGTSPPGSLLVNLVGGSLLMLLIGLFVFNRLQKRFYNFL